MSVSPAVRRMRGPETRDPQTVVTGPRTFKPVAVSLSGEDTDEGRRTLASVQAYLSFCGELVQADRHHDVLFTLVNGLKSLFDFERAFFFCARRDRIVRCSGDDGVEVNSAGMRWLAAVARECCARPDQFDRALLLRPGMVSPVLEEGLRVADRAIVVSVYQDRNGDVLGCLLIALPQASDRATMLLDKLRGVVEAALCVHPAVVRRSRRRVCFGALAGLVVGAALIPMPVMIFAEARVEAVERTVVTAPRAGVVEEVHVRLNDRVRSGDTLFVMDRRDDRGRRTVAAASREARLVSERAVAMAGFADDEKRALLLGQRLELAAAQMAERDISAVVSRSVAKAMRDGWVVSDGLAELVGSSVRLGEPLVTLVDGSDHRLKASIAIPDAGWVSRGARGRFVSDAGDRWPVRVQAIRYGPGGDGVAEGMVQAALAIEPGTHALPDHGARGIVRLHGETRSVLFFLLRRPWAWLRAMVGF